jgi:hypothetical protein
MTEVKMIVANYRRFSHKESQCILASKTKAVKVETPARKVSNFCKIPDHFAYTCWKKEVTWKFSGNESRIVGERADGKIAIVADNKQDVFAKTNSCSETPDTDNLIDLDSNMNVNLDKSRPRSVVGCDRPWRRSTEGRKDQCVLVAMSSSSASENVGRLHEKVKRKRVEVRNSASTDRALGTTRRSKAVTNSEGEHLFRCRQDSMRIASGQ